MKNVLHKTLSLFLALLIAFFGITPLAACGNEEIEAASGKKADTPEKVAKGVVSAMLEGDAEKFISFMHKDILAKMAEDFFGGNEDALHASLEEVIVRAKKNYERKGIVPNDVIYRIIEITEISKTEDEDLPVLLEAGIDIEEAKYVNVEIKYELDGEEKSEKIGVSVCKIDGEWFVLFY